MRPRAAFRHQSHSLAATAAGRPVLYEGSPDGEIARTIEERDVGTVVQLGDVDAMLSALRKYCGNTEIARAQGTRARNLIEKEVSMSACVDAYASVLIGDTND